jgi:hypothetical protein
MLRLGTLGGPAPLMDQDPVAEGEGLAFCQVQRLVEQEGGIQEAAGGRVAVEGRRMATIRGVIQEADAR